MMCLVIPHKTGGARYQIIVRQQVGGWLVNKVLGRVGRYQRGRVECYIQVPGFDSTRAQIKKGVKIAKTWLTTSK